MEHVGVPGDTKVDIQCEMKQYIVMVLGYAREKGSMKKLNCPAGLDDLLVDLEERRS